MFNKYTYTLLSGKNLYASTFTGASAVMDSLLLQYRIVEFDFLKESLKIFNDLTPADTSSLLPLAVRYASPDNNLYVIERPPFEIDLDFSTGKSYEHRKSPKYLKQVKSWIPWTVCVITLGKHSHFGSNYSFSIYFNDKPLTSFDETLIPCFLPNSSNASICMGADSSHVSNMIRNNQPIVDIYNYLFNSYFSGWNCDLHNTLPCSEFFYNNNIIQRITETKKGPKSYDALQWGRSTSKTYNQMLYLLSHLSLEEFLDYISYCKKKYESTPNARFVRNLTNIIESLTPTSRNPDYSHHKNPAYLLDHLSTKFDDQSSSMTIVRVTVSDSSSEDLEHYFSNPYLIAKMYQEYYELKDQNYFENNQSFSLSLTKEELLPYANISEQDNSNAIPN